MNERPAATIEELADRLGDPDVLVLDVRTEEEYAGAAGYPCDPRQGHIPGARNVELAELLGRSPEGIRELVALPEGAEVVAYCRGRYCVYADDAVRELGRRGYRAKRLEDGFPEWKRAGLPVASGEGS